MDFLKLLESEYYDFLRENEHLKDKILFLCVSGSYSYGTNIETSDIDIRGVALNSLEEILGLSTFNVYEDNKTDTVIYGLNKFLALASECNPNIIEMLFCKKEHYFYISDLGKIILDNRHLFLSKRAYYTFSGYAHSQLNRLENALAKNGAILTEEELQNHIKRSVDNALQNCVDKLHFDEDSFNIYVDKDDENEFNLYSDINLKHFPLSDFRIILSETSNVVSNYKEGIGNRNKKKDDLHLNKHMMHLIRLYIMGNEILKTGDLSTYREKEHDMLMDIRNGKYRNPDGSVKKEFYDMLNELMAECERLKEETKLPRSVDKKEIFEKIYKPIYKDMLNNV